MRLLALVLAVGVPLRAGAFTVASGFTEGCHERITLRAFLDFVVALPLDGVALPAETGDDDETWREVARFFGSEFADLAPILADESDVTDEDRFLLMSLLVGVRSPDTEGHSVLNLEALRRLHSDPDPEGQYAHALRGPADDGPEGAVAAVEGTRARISELLSEALAASLRKGAAQLTLGTFYLDFYGRIEIPVNAAFYSLGRAAHAVQDSFSHSVRDEATGYRELVAVLNYIDAIGTNFEEERDGLAHSDSMDDCTAAPGEAGGTVDAAVAATIDLYATLRALRSGLEPHALDAFLGRWFVFREGCTLSDGFCGNTRWVEVLREHQTQPYLEAIFACEARSRPASPAWMVLSVFGGLWMRWARGGHRLRRAPP